MKHIHLIPADFEYFNFDDFINESDGDENGVCWKNGGNDGFRAQAFNIGDEVYIYFHDSRNLTDKILLKATVSKTDLSDDDNKQSIDSNKFLYSEYNKKLLKDKNLMKMLGKDRKKEIESFANSNIKGFYLNNFKAITKVDENKFIYKHGKKNDEDSGIMGVKINQTKLYLDKQDNIKYINLLNELNKTKFNRKLSTLRDDYNTDSCIICTKNELQKHSFLKPNNLYYYEIHHILQQSFKNKQDKYDWFDANKYLAGEEKINTLIYNQYNEVRLCPYHHRLLHYGMLEDRKRVLDKLVNRQYKDNLKAKVKNDRECEQILEYIYEQYNIDYKS